MPSQDDTIDWAKHRKILRRLWLVEDKKRDDIMKFMAENFNFRATRTQYDRKFREWGWRKNLKSQEWRIIGSQIAQSKNAGKLPSVYINGMLVPEETVWRSTRRHDFPTIKERYCPAPRPKTPGGVYICTPPALASQSSFWDNTPWIQFLRTISGNENPLPNLGRLAANLPDVVRGFLTPVPNSVRWYRASELSWILDRASSSQISPRLPEMSAIIKSFHSDLRALLPDAGPLDQNRMSTESGPIVVKGITGDYISLFVYLVSNNRAGIFTSADLIRSIQNLLGATPTIISYYSQPPTVQATLEHLLAQAVKDGNTLLVKELLRCRIPADVNVRGKRSPDETALQHAVRMAYGDIIRLLLAAGANPDARPSGQKTALQVAVDNGDIEVARVLLEAGADPNYTGKINDTHYSDTALHHAAWRMNTPMVELLLLSGADINSIADVQVTTALYWAAGAGGLDMVNLLLKHGAELNDDLSENLPIAGAARSGNIAIVQRLVEVGADVNLARGPSGKTALQGPAGFGGTFEMVRVLLDAGTDVNARASFRVATALQSAVCSNRIEVVQIILDHGAEVNAPPAIPE
ncbi:hypothetical protein ASPCAL02765 [Aspergillus calidoustus]|uniref:Clr5 domain-containing protein n=1 Tax=Aspergillus calidoustus TaxID=454130 RepID=A0A0U5CNB2_ASPCI|nr:hypothetical protein ASPCAL02765 [Aspergillus calidoustus]